MKMIAGLIDTTSGEIALDGRSIAGRRRLEQRMGYVPRSRTSMSHLSGLEYLVMVGQLRDLPAQPRAIASMDCFRLLTLHDDRHVSLSAYSKGMRQKVLLAAALLHNPDLLLLDSRSPDSTSDGAGVARLIQELAARGKVVLFSSHELETVERICVAHRDSASREGRRGRFDRAPANADGRFDARGIFAQLASDHDTAAVSRQIADLDQRLTWP